MALDFTSWATGQRVLYKPLGSKAEDDTNQHIRQPGTRHSLGQLLWALLACFFASTTVLLLVLLVHRRGNWKQGFDTDLRTARPIIELVEIPFTGELAVEDGKWVRKKNSGNVEYVGPPSDAIDKAWRDLIAQAINIDLEGKEAEGFSDTLVWPETGKYFTGLTVHHGIHCLNMLRMGLYRDYYLFPEDPKKRRFTWIHLDHCVDFLRQAIQCQGDLTPMKWYWSDVIHEPVLRPESPHTCRKWENIQEWALQRVHILSEEEKKKQDAKPPPPRGTWVP